MVVETAVETPVGLGVSPVVVGMVARASYLDCRILAVVAGTVVHKQVAVVETVVVRTSVVVGMVVVAVPCFY